MEFSYDEWLVSKGKVTLNNSMDDEQNTLHRRDILNWQTCGDLFTGRIKVKYPQRLIGVCEGHSRADTGYANV